MTEERKQVVPLSKSEFVEQYERSFELNDPAAALVSIANVSGPVRVEVWDAPRVEIRAVKRARSQRSFDRTRVELTQDGDQISARTSVDEEAIFSGFLDLLRGDRAGATVDYHVRMPAASALRAKSVNGSVHIAGVRGRVEASAVNGSVQVRGTTGWLDASTVNGALVAEQIAGSADLNTVNGSIRLVDARLSMLDARTVSGDMHIALTVEPNGSYALNSTNGSAVLLLPADSRCQISMEAVNGGIDVQLPHETVSTEMRPAFSRWRGAINGGGVPITFKTVNGRLRVSAADASAEPAPQMARERETETASQSTMDILRAVERGELTVEQAMERMRAQNS